MKIRKQDSNIVPCVISIPENPKGIVDRNPWFSSSKECATYKMLLRRLPDGPVMVCSELNCRGTARKKPCRKHFVFRGCMDSIEATEKTISETFPGTGDLLFCFKVFGAYITGLYISTREHLGRKAFFPECGRQYAVIIRQKESK